MGMHRYKKLVKKAINIHKLAHASSKFAERYKDLPQYDMRKDIADQYFREFEKLSNKAGRELRCNLRMHQITSSAFMNWLEKKFHGPVTVTRQL